MKRFNIMALVAMAINEVGFGSDPFFRKQKPDRFAGQDPEVAAARIAKAQAKQERRRQRNRKLSQKQKAA